MYGMVTLINRVLAVLMKSSKVGVELFETYGFVVGHASLMPSIETQTIETDAAVQLAFGIDSYQLIRFAVLRAGFIQV